MQKRNLSRLLCFAEVLLYQLSVTRWVYGNEEVQYTSSSYRLYDLIESLLTQLRINIMKFMSVTLTHLSGCFAPRSRCRALQSEPFAGCWVGVLGHCCHHLIQNSDKEGAGAHKGRCRAAAVPRAQQKHTGEWSPGKMPSARTTSFILPQ